jgi:hypothetical protein
MAEEAGVKGEGAGAEEDERDGDEGEHDLNGGRGVEQGWGGKRPGERAGGEEAGGDRSGKGGQETEEDDNAGEAEERLGDKGSGPMDSTGRESVDGGENGG